MSFDFYSRDIFYIMMQYCPVVFSPGERILLRHGERILMDKGNLRKKMYKITN